MSHIKNYVEASPSNKQESGRVKFLTSNEVINMANGTPVITKNRGRPSKNIISGGSVPPKKRGPFNETGGPSGSHEISQQEKTASNNLPYISSKFAWEGTFKARDMLGSKQVEMEAYFSKNMHIKVREIVENFPNNLELNYSPRINPWSKKYNQNTITIDDIGLYLFPQPDKSQDIKYSALLRHINSNHLMLKMKLGLGFELWVYSSEILPSEARNIKRGGFLWAMIFKGKKKKNKKKNARKQKRLSEFYSQNVQNTPQNRSLEATPLVEKTPIAGDKRYIQNDQNTPQNRSLGATPLVEKTPIAGDKRYILSEQNNPQNRSNETSPSIEKNPIAGDKRYIQNDQNTPQNGCKETSPSIEKTPIAGGKRYIQNDQNTPQNRCNATSPSIEKTPIAVDKTALVSQIIVKKELVFDEPAIQKTTQSENMPSESSRRSEPKEKNNNYSDNKNKKYGSGLANVGIKNLKKLLSASQNQSQSPTQDTSASTKSTTKDIIIKQEIMENQNVPPQIIDFPNIPPGFSAKAVIVQEKRSEESLQNKQLDPPVICTAGPCTLKLSFPREQLETPVKVGEVRAIPQKSSENEKTSSASGGTSSNLPAQMESPVVNSRPNLVSQVKQEPGSESSRRNEAVTQMEAPVTCAPSNPVQVKQEGSAFGGVRFAIRPPPGCSKGALPFPNPLSNWRSPFLPGAPSSCGPGPSTPFGPGAYQPQPSPFIPASSSSQPQTSPLMPASSSSQPQPSPVIPASNSCQPQPNMYPDHKPPIRPRFNSYPFPSYPFLPNLRPPVGPATGDVQSHIGVPPHFRVLSNPSFVAEVSNTNRPYPPPPPPREDSFNDDRGGGGGPRKGGGRRRGRGKMVNSRRWDSKSPVRGQGSRSPCRRQDSRSPVRRRDSRSPGRRQDSRSPVRRRDSRSPDRRQESRSPVTRRDSRSPIRRYDSRSSLRRYDSRSPVMRHESRSPIGRQELRSPPNRKPDFRSPIRRWGMRCSAARRRDRSRSRSPVATRGRN